MLELFVLIIRIVLKRALDQHLSTFEAGCIRDSSFYGAAGRLRLRVSGSVQMQNKNEKQYGNLRDPIE